MAIITFILLDSGRQLPASGLDLSTAISSSDLSKSTLDLVLLMVINCPDDKIEALLKRHRVNWDYISDKSNSECRSKMINGKQLGIKSVEQKKKIADQGILLENMPTKHFEEGNEAELTSDLGATNNLISVRAHAETQERRADMTNVYFMRIPNRQTLKAN